MSRSDIPEPPWRSSERERPVRVPLTREDVVEAALLVLERDGAEGLSMRKVADQLETGPATLYWHVRNKGELIDLIVDRVASEVEVPEPDPERWEEQLKEWMIEARRVLLRHRGVGQLTLGRIPMGPNLLRWVEWGLGLARGAGIPDNIAAYSGDLLGLYLGAQAYEADASSSDEEGATDQMMEMVRAYFESLPADRFPNIHETVDELVSGTPDERFELGLDVIIRGLASYKE